MHYTCDLDQIILNLNVASKEELFQAISSALFKDYESDLLQQSFADKLVTLELETSSAIGNHIVVPNAMIDGFESPRHIFARLAQPLHDFKTPDGKPVDIIILLVSPESDGPLHLRRLSRLIRLMQEQKFIQNLREFNDRGAIRGQFMFSDFQAKAA